MNVLVVLPARGGSKSIPKKNIVPLGGKPLIAWAIEAAKAATRVDRVIVDTDNDEIAAVARQCGAETPYLRPAELAQDDTPTMPVLRAGLAWLAEHEDYRPDALLLVQPTSPFIRAEQIDAAIALLEAHPEADSVTTVIELPHHFHPYNLRRIGEDGYLRFAEPELRAAHPTKQSKPAFYAMGNLWLFRPEVVAKAQIPIGDRCLPLTIDWLSAFDLDSPADLAIAEALAPVARAAAPRA